MAGHGFASDRHVNAVTYNINDVLDPVEDEYVGGGGAVCGDGMEAAASDVGTASMSTATTTLDHLHDIRKAAKVVIVEQPQPKALRFRYICEGRSAGSIPGERSSADNKTFPTIQVMGYRGPAAVVVSCVTVDQPYRPHPHNLVGKDGCKKGICTMPINNESMTCVFSNLGIQCVKKRDVEEALRLREQINVDPFRTGFAHRSQPQSIDLNAVRLCFQVFVRDPIKDKLSIPLTPVVSRPIYDKKATSDLLISKLSDCSCTVAGGKEIILLCEKVTKEDIQVRFFEEKNGQITWESAADFNPSDVHKQVAIAFKTPRYKNLEIENPVNVYIQLLRPSDKQTSEPRPFQYLPLDSDAEYVRRKVARFGNTSNTENITRFLAENIAPPAAGYAEGPRIKMMATRSSRASAGAVKMEKVEPCENFGSLMSPPNSAVGGVMAVEEAFSTKQEASWLGKPSPQQFTPSESTEMMFASSNTPHHSAPQPLGALRPTDHCMAPSDLQYYCTPTHPAPSTSLSPYVSELPFQSPRGAGEGDRFSMVLGSGAGGVVTVSPSQASPRQLGTSGVNQLLGLDTSSSSSYLTPHVLQSPQQHLLLSPVSNSSVGSPTQEPETNSPTAVDSELDQINSAELMHLPPSDMTGFLVNAHLSDNLSSNLNIIGPSPTLSPAMLSEAVSAAAASGMDETPHFDYYNTGLNLLSEATSSGTSNNLNSSLPQPSLSGSYQPNIVGSDAVRLLVPVSSGPGEVTATASDSLTNLHSELQFLNKALI